MIIAIISGVVWGTIWGVATNKVLENKGYDDNWFWWGFFFSFIPLIIACTKPQKYNHLSQNISNVNTNNVEAEKTTPSYNRVIQNKSKNIPEKVDVNSVVNIREYEIIRGDDEAVFLNVRMKNIGNQSIKALKMHISGSNAFMEKISFGDKGYFEVLIQDLHFSVGAEITHKFELSSNQKDIRHFEFWVSQVCYSNDEIIKCEEPLYIKTCQEVVDLKYLSYIQSVRKDASYYMIKYPKGWQCICGNVNIGEKCSNCDLMFQNAEKFGKDLIEKNYSEYKRLKDEEEYRRKKDEQERKEREAEEKRKIAKIEEAERIKQAKIKRVRYIILALVGLILVIVLGYNKIYLPIKKDAFYKNSEEYIKGMEWYEEGVYLQALNNFEKIEYTGEEYLESCYQYGLHCKEMGDDCKEVYYGSVLTSYEKSSNAVKRAHYERAVVYFEKVMKYDYKDSAELYKEMEEWISLLK